MARLKFESVEPRKCLYRKIIDPDNGEVLDNILVAWFPWPKDCLAGKLDASKLNGVQTFYKMKQKSNVVKLQGRQVVIEARCTMCGELE